MRKNRVGFFFFFFFFNLLKFVFNGLKSTCICVLTAFRPSFPHLETFKKILENSTLSRYVKKNIKKSTDQPNFQIWSGEGNITIFFFWPYFLTGRCWVLKRSEYSSNVRSHLQKKFYEDGALQMCRTTFSKGWSWQWSFILTYFYLCSLWTVWRCASCPSSTNKRVWQTLIAHKEKKFRGGISQGCRFSDFCRNSDFFRPSDFFFFPHFFFSPDFFFFPRLFFSSFFFFFFLCMYCMCNDHACQLVAFWAVLIEKKALALPLDPAGRPPDPPVPGYFPTFLNSASGIPDFIKRFVSVFHWHICSQPIKCRDFSSL